MGPPRRRGGSTRLSRTTETARADRTPPAAGANMMRLLLAAALAFVCFAGSAEAHVRSQSQSRWTIDGDHVALHVEAAAIDVTRLYAFGSEAPLEAVFADEVALGFDV